MKLGERLKELRKNSNLTQKEVAELLGVSKPVISQYENDARIPSIDKLISLSRIYKASLDYICGNIENNNYNSFHKDK